MFLGQASQFASQGGKIDGLDFEEEIVPNDVYVKTVYFGFNVVSTLSLPSFK
jgi:hypothetical protein